MPSDRVLRLEHRAVASAAASAQLLVRCAWGQHPDTVLDLPSYSQVLRARFAVFSVVSPVMKLVLRLRPTHLQLDHLCTDSADILRLAHAMGVIVSVDQNPQQATIGDSSDDRRWAMPLLELLSGPAGRQRGLGVSPEDDAHFSYEHYALTGRDHNLLIDWCDRVMPFFTDRRHVLDLGCGTGVFLDQLARRGIRGSGIDVNDASVRYARLLGLDARCADAATFLEDSAEAFDAIHCSHVVEHLAWPDLTDLMQRLAAAVATNGVIVLVFPDPESIRSQLLGFWRDPDHVRFYHPDVIATLAESCGLTVDFNSQRSTERKVVPFAMTPPSPPSEVSLSDVKTSDDVLRALAAMARRIEAQDALIQQLWMVNQTWAWPDDAILVLRK